MVRFLAELPLVHQEMFKRQGAQFDISEEELSKAATVLGKVLENAIIPFDRWLLKREDTEVDTFIIPLIISFPNIHRNFHWHYEEELTLYVQN